MIELIECGKIGCDNKATHFYWSENSTFIYRRCALHKHINIDGRNISIDQPLDEAELENQMAVWHTHHD